MKKHLKKIRKIQKKTWELLKELSTGQNATEKINNLKINGVYTKNDQESANKFNNFFTKIGQEISDSVKPTSKKAESYLTMIRHFPNLNLIQLDPL